MSRTLAAEAVTFAYEREVPVLRGVHARVIAGRVTGIVGPNGCGKSTLLRLLSGLLRPDAGSITLDGQPLSALPARKRAQLIGFLPQAVDPIFSLTAFEVVCLGRYPHLGGLAPLSKHDHDVVRRCMGETASEAFAKRAFSELSGGERQRVLLAGILAQEAELLLLDEPTAALDIHHEAEVFALLARLARDGYGVGVVTHDLNLAGTHCDELVLISGNHDVVASGPPAEVLQGSLLTAAYGAPIRVGLNPLTGGPLVAAGCVEGAP
jgi:iron complex transport system ATP-binding protein